MTYLLPENHDELRSTLTTMRNNGAPKEAMQSVLDGFKDREAKGALEVKPTTKIFSTAADAVAPAAKELPAQRQAEITKVVNEQNPLPPTVESIAKSKITEQAKTQVGAEAQPLSDEEKERLEGRGIAAKVGAFPMEVAALFEKGMQKLKGETKPTTFIKQFGTAAEILEESEGKDIDEIRKDLISKGLNTDQADRAILNTIDAIQSSPDRTGIMAKASQILSQEVAPIGVGLAVGAGAGSLAAKAAYGIAPAATQAIQASKIGRVVAGAVRGAVEGAAGQAAYNVAKGDDITDDTTSAALFGGGLGAAFRVAAGVPGVLKGAKNIVKKVGESVGGVVSGFTLPKTLNEAAENVVNTALKSSARQAVVKQGAVGAKQFAPKIKEALVNVADYAKTKGIPMPQDTAELLQTATSLSDDIFKQYDDIATKTNLKVSLDGMIKPLEDFTKKNFLDNPKFQKILSTTKEEVKKAGKVSPKQLQDQIASLNARLRGANFNVLNINQQADLVKLAALRNIFKTEVVDKLGSKYANLRKAYGATAELKKALIRSGAQAKGAQFGDLGDIIIAAEVVSSPSIEGVALMGAKEGLKRAKNPDINIQKFFQAYEQIGQQADQIKVAPSAVEKAIVDIPKELYSRAKGITKIAIDKLSQNQISTLAKRLGVGLESIARVGTTLTINESE